MEIAFGRNYKESDHEGHSTVLDAVRTCCATYVLKILMSRVTVPMSGYDVSVKIKCS